MVESFAIGEQRVAYCEKCDRYERRHYYLSITGAREIVLTQVCGNCGHTRSAAFESLDELAKQLIPEI